MVGFRIAQSELPTMKVCPICQQKYADSLQYCLSDGTVLSVFNNPQATLRLETRQTQPPTQVRRGLTFGVLALVGVGLVGRQAEQEIVEVLESYLAAPVEIRREVSPVR